MCRGKEIQPNEKNLVVIQQMSPSNSKEELLMFTQPAGPDLGHDDLDYRNRYNFEQGFLLQPLKC